MQRAARQAAMLAILSLAALAGLAHQGAAQEELTPRYWNVTGVDGNDVLHLRDVPSADSKSLARIPPGARHLKNLGCRRNQPPLEQWMRMSAAQKRDATTRWCRVEYQGTEGWVAGRFLVGEDKAHP
jgi:hypothetical protein